MFGIAFRRPRNTFNSRLVKKIKSVFKCSKSLKMAKKHFGQKLKNKAFAKKLFFNLKALFLKVNPKHALSVPHLTVVGGESFSQMSHPQGASSTLGMGRRQFITNDIPASCCPPAELITSAGDN
jgi:hypothetical protein